MYIGFVEEEGRIPTVVLDHLNRACGGRKNCLKVAATVSLRMRERKKEVFHGTGEKGGKRQGILMVVARPAPDEAAMVRDGGAAMEM